MDIPIDDTSKLCDIQKEFSKHFPYLKLEFFGYEPEEKKRFTRKNLIIDTSKTIGEICHLHHSGYVSINGHQKVSTLEQNFRENHGINVQVFRKSGKIWLETTATDHWTLSQQNCTGQETALIYKDEEVPDYDLYHEQL